MDEERIQKNSEIFIKNLAGRVAEYICQHLLPVILWIFFLAGAVFLFHYYLFVAQYLPDVSGVNQNEVILVVLGAFIFGFLMIIYLFFFLAAPGMLWRLFNLPTSLGRKSLLVVFLVFLVFEEAMFYLDGSALKNKVFYVVGGIIVSLILGLILLRNESHGDFSGRDASRRWSDRWNFFRFFVAPLLITLMAVLPMISALVMMQSPLFKAIPIPSGPPVVINAIIVFGLVSFGFAVNLGVIIYKEAIYLAVVPLILIFVLAVPSLSPKIVHALKIGNYSADLTLNENGCMVIRDLISKGRVFQEEGEKYCRISNVTVLSAFGTKLLIVLNGKRILIDKSDVLLQSSPVRTGLNSNLAASQSQRHEQ